LTHSRRFRPSRRLVSPPAPLARISGQDRWEHLDRRQRPALEEILTAFLRTRRWFGGKARRITTATIADAVPLPAGALRAHVLLLNVEYADGEAEQYVLTLAHASGARGARVRETMPAAVVAPLPVGDTEGVLYDATWDKTFGRALIQAFARRRRFRGAAGEIVARPSPAFKTLAGPSPASLEAALLSAEQSNTSIRYGDRLILKLFRRVEEGVHPDLELTSFLTEASFQHVPRVAGALEYRSAGGGAMTLGILQAFVPNRGDAWQFALRSVDRYFDRVLSLSARDLRAEVPRNDLLDLADSDPPPRARELTGTFLESARLLGRRTAEMHLVLAAGEDSAFAPEPFTASYQRALYESISDLTEQVFHLLRTRLQVLPAAARADASRLMRLKPTILNRCRAIIRHPIAAMRTRHHGDYHLGQVLWTGRDFVMFDFEGEPTRPLSTRRAKRSALRDVAGMIRSFHYAAHSGLNRRGSDGGVAALEPWADCWHLWVSAAFLRSYLRATSGAAFLPRSRGDLDVLLTTSLLEKAVYELGYELNNRPDWVALPLRGILRLVRHARAVRRSGQEA
jgi:maltose alpha-D-glucosyltransferase/alpha-amylase